MVVSLTTIFANSLTTNSHIMELFGLVPGNFNQLSITPGCILSGQKVNRDLIQKTGLCFSTKLEVQHLFNIIIFFFDIPHWLAFQVLYWFKSLAGIKVFICLTIRSHPRSFCPHFISSNLYSLTLYCLFCPLTCSSYCALSPPPPSLLFFPPNLCLYSLE